LPQLLNAMKTKKVVINAVKVSAVVGTVLNMINQGPDLYQGNPIVWWKIVLNYAVPYLVASYSAAKIQLQSR